MFLYGFKRNSFVLTFNWFQPDSLPIEVVTLVSAETFQTTKKERKTGTNKTRKNDKKRVTIIVKRQKKVFFHSKVLNQIKIYIPVVYIRLN